METFDISNVTAQSRPSLKDEPLLFKDDRVGPCLLVHYSWRVQWNSVTDGRHDDGFNIMHWLDNGCRINGGMIGNGQRFEEEENAVDLTNGNKAQKGKDDDHLINVERRNYWIAVDFNDNLRVLPLWMGHDFSIC